MMKACPVERAIPIQGRMFVCPNRAASIVGVASETLYRWFRRGTTSYGYPVRTVRVGKHRLADERDVWVMAGVNRDVPLVQGGAGREEREQMKARALALRANFEPSP